MFRSAALWATIALCNTGCALAAPAKPTANGEDSLFFTEIKELNEANSPNYTFSGEAQFPVFNSNGVALAKFSLSAINVHGSGISHSTTVNPFGTNGWEQAIANLISNIKRDPLFKDIVLPDECPASSIQSQEAFKPANPDIDGNYTLTAALDLVPTTVGTSFRLTPLSSQNEPIFRAHLALNTTGSGGSTVTMSHSSTSNNWDDLVISCGAYDNSLTTVTFVEIP